MHTFDFVHILNSVRSFFRCVVCFFFDILYARATYDTASETMPNFIPINPKITKIFFIELQCNSNNLILPIAIRRYHREIHWKCIWHQASDKHHIKSIEKLIYSPNFHFDEISLIEKLFFFSSHRNSNQNFIAFDSNLFLLFQEWQSVNSNVFLSTKHS